MHGNDCCGSIEYNIDTSRNSNQCNPLEESMTERLESSSIVNCCIDIFIHT